MFRPLAFIRNGWWVAVAGFVVAVAIVSLALMGPTDVDGDAAGDGRNPSSYGFDLSSSLIPVTAIVAAGMHRDGLPVLHLPKLVRADEVARRNQEGRGKFLLQSDRVLGVEMAGEARAYPIRLMRWHEVINDVVAGRPILVTYNPLCDAAVVSDRVVAGEVREFGVSGLVFNSNPLLYDRQPNLTDSSLWSQLDSQALTGPAAAHGLSLTIRPSSLTTWGQWVDRHPETLVLAPLDRLARVYKRDPYHSYFGSDLLHFPVTPLPPPGQLAAKARMVILTVDGRNTVLSLDRIAAAAGAERGSFTTTVDGIPLTIHYDAVVGAALVDWPDDLEDRVASRQAFWFAWFSHHPDTSPPLPPPS